MKILIIEDEQRLARNIQKGLKAENYSAEVAFDGEEGLVKGSHDCDLIILDLMLPKMSGFEVLQELRDKKISTPIIILTAKDSIEDKIKGLDLGADDYLSKPFSFEELLARMRALLRRSTEKSVILKVDNLELDPKTKRVERAGKEIKLSGTEYRLLEYMMRHKDWLMDESKIITHVWDYDYDGFSNIVPVYMRYLRNKIDRAFPDEKPLIYTIRGMGYKITDK